MTSRMLALASACDCDVRWRPVTGRRMDADCAAGYRQLSSPTPNSVRTRVPGHPGFDGRHIDPGFDPCLLCLLPSLPASLTCCKANRHREMYRGLTLVLTALTNPPRVCRALESQGSRQLANIDPGTVKLEDASLSKVYTTTANHFVL